MTDHIGFGPMTGNDTPDKRKSVGTPDPRLTRTNYFDGRLLTAKDLIRDQLYLDDRAREVGRAIGSGIAHGLEVQLSDYGLLTVKPGLAVAPSGRVLELTDRALYLNLYDQALLSELNDGKSQVLDNGLYAVAIQYAESGEDSAEVYPQDLASERSFHYNTWSEGVEVVLIPLRTPLPQTNKLKGQRRLSGHRGLGARAALVPELVYRDGQPPELPGDAVALALLAIRDQRPQWLDLGLVRRPLRPQHSPLALHHDLHRHYGELFHQVTTVRKQLDLNEGYPADLYFRHLPAHGPLPKECVNPTEGTQVFFPKQVQVQIAPVREGDLPALIAESTPLDPIDLESDEPAEVMVVVPMNDTTFAWRARQLQHDAGALQAKGHTRLAHIDPLALRLRFRPPAHVVDTDASVWASIWAETKHIYYLRRPPRVAETQVSAVVLAAGYTLPAPGERPPPNTLELVKLLADARDRLKRSEAELARANRELSRLAETPDAAALADCRARVQEAEQRLQDARDSANELAAEAEQLRTRTAEVEAKWHEAEDRVAALRRQLDEIDGGSTDLRGQLEACQAEAAELRQRLSDANARAAMADALQIERDRLDVDLSSAQARIRDLEARISGGDAALQEQLADCQARVAELRDDLAAAQAAAAEAGELRTDRDNLAQRLSDADERILELQQQLNDDAASAEARLTDCQQSLAEAEQARSQLAGQLATAQARIQQLEQQLEQGDANLRARLQDCEQARAELTAQLESANNRAAEADALRADRDRLTAQLAASNARVTELKTETEQLQQALQECEQSRGGAVDLNRMIQQRKITDRTALADARKLLELVSGDAQLSTGVADVLLLVERRYDPVLYGSLINVVRRNRLPTFIEFLQAHKPNEPLGPAVAQAGAGLGLTAVQRQQWSQLSA